MTDVCCSPGGVITPVIYFDSGDTFALEDFSPSLQSSEHFKFCEEPCREDLLRFHQPQEVIKWGFPSASKCHEHPETCARSLLRSWCQTAETSAGLGLPHLWVGAIVSHQHSSLCKGVAAWFFRLRQEYKQGRIFSSETDFCPKVCWLSGCAGSCDVCRGYLQSGWMGTQRKAGEVLVLYQPRQAVHASPYIDVCITAYK